MTNFPCEKCGKIFPTQRGLKVHRLMKHDGQAKKNNRKRWAKKPRRKPPSSTERQAHRALVIDLLRRLMIELDSI